MDERCELTDLLRAFCAHCTGRNGDGVVAETVPSGPWITAQYRGSCSGCRAPIRPEDPIRSDGEGGWLCEPCGQ